MANAKSSNTYQYDAFISYSSEDKAFAERLEKALEKYKPPKDLNLPQRYLNVFRYETDMTGTEYYESIREHLSNSAKVIVVCSPSARKSRYVNEELQYFAECNDPKNIIPIIVAGVSNNEAADDQEEEKAFPEALCEVLEMPLAISYTGIDLKKEKLNKGIFEGSWYTLLANIFKISRDRIEQRDKKRQLKRRRVLSGVVISVITALSILTGVALWQRGEAKRQQHIAEQNQAEAERQQHIAEQNQAEAERQQHIAEQNQAEAERQQQIALARQLAAQAELTRNQRASLLPRSVLLAVESMRRFPSFEAEQALRHGLTLLPRPVAGMNHEAVVCSVVFSPDGKYLATASKDTTARVWEAASGKEVGRMNHEDAVWSVAFSPDGKYLATVSEDKTARLWEPTSGREVGRMNHEDAVWSVAFSPDGKYLATVSEDKTARVWEAASGKEVARMSHDDVVHSVAFSPEGKYLATASEDNTARVWFLWPEDLIAEASSRLTRNLTYQEWQRYLPDEPYRKTCPNLPIHPSFIEAGRDLGREGDVKGAIAIFRRAVELEPTLDLEPETEAQRLAPQSND